MSELFTITNAILFVAIVSVTYTISMVFYYRGYYIGYKEGLDYGLKGLEDYHQHTMHNLKSLNKQ
jgi:hypothetical protein